MTLTFKELGLDEKILQALDEMEFKEPSDVQAKAIPEILKKKDVIALARTGSGKTAACAIPLCHQVDVEKTKIQALIIVPTRELALQYATQVQKIGGRRKVKAFALLGGESADLQRSKLENGVHILIATPGRLIDFIFGRHIDLSRIQTVVLDEADEMLSMGFSEDLEFIFQCMLQDHQTLLFSATMPEAIKKIADTHMKNPIQILLNKTQASPETIEHQFFFCRRKEKEIDLKELILQLDPKQSIIFCHSRMQCEKLCRYLQKEVKAVDYLHAGLSQEVRSMITGRFRSGKIRFLIATDIAARGLDFSGITHVFIYQLSEDPEIYVHRSGRTGRYGKEGMVITLVSQKELAFLPKVMNLIKKEVKWIGEPPQVSASLPLRSFKKKFKRTHKR